MSDVVFIQMTLEEASKRFLRENNLCAIDWNVVHELIHSYLKHGNQELVFDPEKATYILRERRMTA